MTEQEFKQHLVQFTGSERIFKNSLGVFYTEGVQWVCCEVGTYWFLDIIASYQYMLKDQEFQVWKLKKTGDSTAIAVCEDGSKKILIKQGIPYTDYPYSELIFWCVDKITLLPGEY